MRNRGGEMGRLRIDDEREKMKRIRGNEKWGC